MTLYTKFPHEDNTLAILSITHPWKLLFNSEYWHEVHSDQNTHHCLWTVSWVTDNASQLPYCVEETFHIFTEQQQSL